jgi:hypothetical protein
MAKHEPKLVAHVAPDSLHYRMGAAAVRTFKIAVLDERHWRVVGSKRVIVFVYRNCKLRCFHDSISGWINNQMRDTLPVPRRRIMVAAADHTSLSGNLDKIFAFV